MSNQHDDLTNRWLPQRQAANFIGVAVSTLAKWRRTGFGPPYSAALGRDPRYLKSHLEAFMANAMATNTAEARKLRK